MTSSYRPMSADIFRGKIPDDIGIMKRGLDDSTDSENCSTESQQERSVRGSIDQGRTPELRVSQAGDQVNDDDKEENQSNLS